MKNIFPFLLKFLLAFLLVSLAIGFYYLYVRIESLSKGIELGSTDNINRSFSGKSRDTTTIDEEKKDECGEMCKKEIERIVSDAIATLSGTKVVTNTQISSSPKTTYISLGSTHTTTSTDWINIDDTKVYIDLEKDYGKSAKVSWEASLKVAHGNGKVFVRLYDDTNKIAVDFSEISTENNSTFKQVSTGNLPFWRGRNLYVVQIKSLNSFEVTYSGGRIKISY